MKGLEEKQSVFKIRRADNYQCSADAGFPCWLAEVVPQAWTCLDKGGPWWLSPGPEDLPISHKPGLAACLRKRHDSSWQLSVCYLKWARGAMSNLGLEMNPEEPRPLSVSLTRSGLEEVMWREGRPAAPQKGPCQHTLKLLPPPWKSNGSSEALERVLENENVMLLHILLSSPNNTYFRLQATECLVSQVHQFCIPNSNIILERKCILMSHKLHI